jgi:hypothetical protein
MSELWDFFKERFFTKARKLDLKDVTKNTDMHWAVVFDSPERLEAHIKATPGDKHKRNRLGFTPGQLARLLGKKKCGAILGQEPEGVILFRPSGSAESLTVSPEEFLRYTGVRWSRTLQFEDFDTLLAVYLQVEEAHRWRQLDSEALWLGTYHRRDIEMGREAKISIRWIDSKIGYGVFAEEELKKDAYVAEYAGLVRRRPYFQWHVSDYAFRYPTAVWSRAPYQIDAEKVGNATRYFNHSETPNCEAVGVLAGTLIHILFRTTRKVEPNEELRFDYGPFYWRNRFLSPGS